MHLLVSELYITTYTVVSSHFGIVNCILCYAVLHMFIYVHVFLSNCETKFSKITIDSPVVCSIPDGLTPFGRMMALLEWYLTSFHVGQTGCTTKKPYNPIIGETFHCSWRIQNVSPCKGQGDLKSNCTHETVNLGPQSGSRSVAENIATVTNVNFASDGFISGQNSVLANHLETRYPTDAKTQGKHSEIHTVVSKCTSASLLLKEGAEDSVEKRSCVTDSASAVIELTYTAEQVSHHPPGMLQQNT